MKPFTKKDNLRPPTNLDDQYTFLLWQINNAAEDLDFHKYMVSLKEDVISELDKQLKETYSLIQEQHKK